MTTSDPTARRAQRLLRLYPKAWRDRYGDEFTELLIADISEQKRSWRRSLDVVRAGLVARLARLGLSGLELQGAEQVRACLASLSCYVAVFLGFGMAMWSQLAIGWQWSEPSTAATTVATVAISIAVLAFLLLAVLAGLPVVWTLMARVARRRSKGLVGPATLLIGSAVILFVGGRHFANGWPGTGGHPWAHQGLVPGGLAAFSWASTLSVSSYWAHPSALARFPSTELAWMALSPLALGCLVLGAAKLVRRLDFPAPVLLFEIRLATAASIVMGVFLVGCCLWIVDGGPGPRNLFHAGAIDVMGTIVMMMTFGVAQRAVRGARRGTEGPTRSAGACL